MATDPLRTDDRGGPQAGIAWLPWAATPKAGVIALVALVCLTLVAFQVQRALATHNEQIADAKVSTANLALSLTQHADHLIKQADLALTDLVERLEAGAQDAPARDRLRRWVGQRAAELPQLRRLTLMDADGRETITSDRGPAVAVVRNDDRAYFQFHRDHPGRGLRVGQPYHGKSNNAWVLPLTRRIDAPDGSFAGVALASLDLDQLRDFYGRFDTGPHGAIGLMTESGLLLTRWPAAGAPIGASVAGGELFRDHVSRAPSGTAEILSSADKIMRINSYRHIATYPLIVSVAVSRDDVLAIWRQNCLTQLLATLAAITGLILISRRLIRQIDLRTRIEQDLRRAHAELDTANQALGQLAFRDGLTGLANRRAFDSRLAEELARARRAETPLALAMFDIDHFKLFNDRDGHPAGDRCLADVGAALLALERRPGDLAARYGGEEFALILVGADNIGALSVAERARRAIQALGVPHPGNAGGVVTVSVGVACLNPVQPDDSAQALIRSADSALYRAKAGGRNRVHAEPAELPTQQVRTAGLQGCADSAEPR